MTCKIKRRSLRCGGRPKADFGSIFTTFIAPALGVAGSVADSAISKTQVSKSNTKPAVKETNTEATNNNTSVENLPTIQVPTKEPISGLITSNTIIPSDPTKTPTMRLGGRKKCWIGAAIGAATSIAGSLFGNSAQKREMRRQKSIQDWQNTTQEAANMTTALNNSQDYQEDYLRQFRTAARLGKTLGAKGIYITDGGDATKIGNNTYLLRGGSHEDVNETGQTGIGINVGGNEVEAEGGEVAQKKNGALRIFSAQPILGNGMSPAQAILRGYNKDSVFNAQQAFKKRNGLKDDGTKQYRSGGEVPYNHYDPTGLFGGSPHPLAKMVDISGITSYGDVKKLIDKKKRGEIPTTQEYLGALSAIPVIGRITKLLNSISNVADATTFMKDVKESEAKENAYQNEVVKYMDIHGRIKTGRRGSMPYSAHELRKRLGGRAKAKIGTETNGNENKTRGGAEIEPYYDWARNTSSNLGISFIDPTYDYRAYYNSVTPYERALIRFAPQGTHFTDIGKTPKHPTFSNESKYSNDKTPGGTWNGNVFVPNIWQFGNNGNSRRNKYMNNSGEGYFNGRVNIFPTSRKRHSLGGCSRPVKGMRPKAAIGIYVPYNKRYTSIYDAPDYSSDYNGGNVLGNGEVTVTAKRIKPTFMKPNNDAMNIINHPANETPYIPQRHNRSRTIFSGGDYLGLGIDTLAALSTGLVNYNTAGKYVLPDRAPIIQASKLPTTYNVNPEIEEVKRYRDRLTGQTFNNTSSSVAALNRSGAINLDALSNLSKLWATKENEENKMLTEDAKNQQTVAAQNVQNELARQSEIARIKNEANQAKGDALNVGLSGLSQAWTNFWTAGRTAYEDDQSRRAMIASSKNATPTRLMEMNFDLSPDVIAALYRTSNEDRTKRFYLSRLSPKQRQKYGIN